MIAQLSGHHLSGVVPFKLQMSIPARRGESWGWASKFSATTAPTIESERTARNCTRFDKEPANHETTHANSIHSVAVSIQLHVSLAEVQAILFFFDQLTRMSWLQSEMDIRVVKHEAAYIRRSQKSFRCITCLCMQEYESRHHGKAMHTFLRDVSSAFKVRENSLDISGWPQLMFIIHDWIYMANKL